MTPSWRRSRRGAGSTSLARPASPARSSTPWHGTPSGCPASTSSRPRCQAFNRFGPDDVAPSATVTGLFMQPGFRAAQAEGRFRHLPLPFSGFVDHLAATARLRCLPGPGRAARRRGPAARWAPRSNSRRSRWRAAVAALRSSTRRCRRSLGPPRSPSTTSISSPKPTRHCRPTSPAPEAGRRPRSLPSSPPWSRTGRRSRPASARCRRPSSACCTTGGLYACTRAC